MAMPIRWWLVLLALVAPAANAATACPVMREPGLTPPQVDDVVARLYAQGLHKRLRELVRARAFKAQHADDGELADYDEATRTVGEALGFDAREVFSQAARAKGSDRPDESLTVLDLQALARDAYARGHDAPAQVASPGVDYAVSGISVHAPESPAGDWLLTTCSHRNVTFMRLREGRFVAASLRALSAVPEGDEDMFVDEIESALRRRLPTNARPNTWKFVADTTDHGSCIAASVTLGPHGDGGSFLLRSRICPAAAGRPLGYAILYAELAQAGVDLDMKAAEGFISTTAPK